MKFTKVQTPRGFKDILPPDGYKKHWFETEAAAYLEEWGYRRIVTPTLEFYDALVQGNGPSISEKLYRFVDRDGHTLALRPEMTIPIARMAATRYRHDEMPMRLFYVGNVFRYDDPQTGRQREFTQVGAELLGEPQPIADAELVVLAVSLLRKLGLRSFRVDLGHIGYIHSLLQEVGDVSLAGEMRQALLQRDYVKYEEAVQQSRLPEELVRLLVALPTQRGGAEVIAAARTMAQKYPAACAALDDLDAIYRLVVAYGMEEHVAVDLGVVKDFNYYTGFLLEGYTPELGFTLCSGGRYDTLVGRFGPSCPATGFAFGVERAMLALERQGWSLEEPLPELLLYSTETDGTLLFAAAAHLRERGIRVEFGTAGMDGETARGGAALRGINRTGRVYRADDGRIGLDVTPADGLIVSGPLDQALSAVSKEEVSR